MQYLPRIVRFVRPCWCRTKQEKKTFPQFDLEIKTLKQIVGVLRIICKPLFGLARYIQGKIEVAVQLADISVAPALMVCRCAALIET